MDETGLILVAAGGNQPLVDLPLIDVMDAAVAALPTEGLEVVAKSDIFLTPCFPVGAGPDYANLSIALRDRENRSPAEVLLALHRIEARFGRTRDIRWGQRVLDLDLLAVGGAVLPDAGVWNHWQMLAPDRQAVDAPNQLILPHPRMQDRAFVLVPLAQIAPDWVHPVLGRSVAQMLAALPQADRDAIRVLADSGLVNGAGRP